MDIVFLVAIEMLFKNVTNLRLTLLCLSYLKKQHILQGYYTSVMDMYLWDISH